MHERLLQSREELTHEIENKLVIADSVELARVEERNQQIKSGHLFLSGTLDELKAGSFESLARIHAYLFDEIYDFAGKIAR
jgi:cell filamentation protein